ASCSPITAPRSRVSPTGAEGRQSLADKAPHPASSSIASALRPFVRLTRRHTLPGRAYRVFHNLALTTFDALLPPIRFSPYRGFVVYHHRDTSLVRWLVRGALYEAAVSRAIAAALERTEAPLVVDVGANIGLMTLNVLAERPDARVVAFEPGPL